MSYRLLSLAGAFALSLGTAGLTSAQSTTTPQQGQPTTNPSGQQQQQRKETRQAGAEQKTTSDPQSPDSTRTQSGETTPSSPSQTSPAQNPSTQTSPAQTATTSTSGTSTDQTWTAIEYPADREVIVNLTPGADITGATGKAKIKRAGAETAINLDVTGVTGDQRSQYLYAVDPSGKLTNLGTLTVKNGTGTLTAKTPLDKFMLVLSPEANLTTVSPETKVIFRSSVPEGYAVVPRAEAKQP